MTEPLKGGVTKTGPVKGGVDKTALKADVKKNGSNVQPSYKKTCKHQNNYLNVLRTTLNRVGRKAFKLNKEGGIIAKNFMVIKHLPTNSHGLTPHSIFRGSYYYLTLQDNTTIIAWKSDGVSASTSNVYSWGDDHRLDADRHGVTFTNGEFWIDNDQAYKLLKGGGFVTTTTPHQGDVAVFPFDHEVPVPSQRIAVHRENIIRFCINTIDSVHERLMFRCDGSQHEGSQGPGTVKAEVGHLIAGQRDHRARLGPR